MEKAESRSGHCAVQQVLKWQGSACGRTRCRAREGQREGNSRETVGSHG